MNQFLIDGGNHYLLFFYQESEAEMNRATGIRINDFLHYN